MSKRVALLGSIAALAVLSASSANAQYWGGPDTVTVSTYPSPYPYPYPYESHYVHRDSWWSAGGRYYGDGPYYYRDHPRLPFFYGDHFVPYGYGYRETGYREGYGGYDY
jgi:hypothetical protein